MSRTSSAGSPDTYTPLMGIAEKFQDVVDWRVQKLVYPVITRRIADEALFLNFGYEEDPPLGIPLTPADEADRFSIQLYHVVATQADIADKTVLEVGCGHGGGASYLTRTLKPASYTGLDLNPKAIEFCRTRHQHAGLRFLRGDAENLPFDDDSFDAVINVESSLHYRRFERFLEEVRRVLRPGGSFLYTDVRPPWYISSWDAVLRNYMTVVAGREINAEAVRGMEGAASRWHGVINTRIPSLLRGVVRRSWGGGRVAGLLCPQRRFQLLPHVPHDQTLKRPKPRK